MKSDNMEIANDEMIAMSESLVKERCKEFNIETDIDVRSKNNFPIHPSARTCIDIVLDSFAFFINKGELFVKLHDRYSELEHSVSALLELTDLENDTLKEKIDDSKIQDFLNLVYADSLYTTTESDNDARKLYFDIMHLLGSMSRSIVNNEVTKIQEQSIKLAALSNKMYYCEKKDL